MVEIMCGVDNLKNYFTVTAVPFREKIFFVHNFIDLIMWKLNLCSLWNDDVVLEPVSSNASYYIVNSKTCQQWCLDQTIVIMIIYQQNHVNSDNISLGANPC